jgi:hypothetical protein
MAAGLAMRDVAAAGGQSGPGGRHAEHVRRDAVTSALERGSRQNAARQRKGIRILMWEVGLMTAGHDGGQLLDP